jgi:two-component system LytT family sensor kinase
MKFTVNITKLVRHSLCWLVLIFYELLLVYLSAGKFPPLVVYFSYYCCNLCLFYAHVSILTVTLSSDKPRYFKLFFLFVGEMIVILALKLGLDILFLSPVHTGNTKFQDLRLTGTFNLMRNIYYVAFGTLYWAINKINNYQREADAAEISRLKAANENVDLEVKLAKTQNAYLQQQINPHLLFNSLNFIHSSVYKLSPEAAENIILYPSTG